MIYMYTGIAYSSQNQRILLIFTSSTAIYQYESSEPNTTIHGILVNSRTLHKTRKINFQTLASTENPAYFTVAY